MRVAISAPPKWKSVQKWSPSTAALVKEWLSVQLDAALIKGEVKAATSLQLGLDTFFAALCRSKGIPYTVFLACDEQDIFWDEERRETFRSLLDDAEEVVRVQEGSYTSGCINRQYKAITDWLKDGESKLLLIKNKALSKSQVERKKELKLEEVKTYNVGKIWKRR